MKQGEGKDNLARYIKTNALDNVGIIVNEGGLPAGTALSEGLVLEQDIPQGHKVALEDIEKHEPIIRYGVIIGYASRKLKRGSWVDESAVNLPEAPDLDMLLAETIAEFKIRKRKSCSAICISQVRSESDNLQLSKERPGKEYYFEGYRNADGSIGTKNLLGLVPSVQCVAGVLNVAAARIEKELLPHFPHVDGVVVLNHGYGCGVAISAAEAEIPIRTIQNLAVHPNFGGHAIIVGLGCEKLQPEKVAAYELGESMRSSGLGQSIIRLQEFVGFSAMVAQIMKMAEDRLEILEKRRRERCSLSELVVGVQCGGSDAFSGITANPAIGYASDLLVNAGATVMFSEVTEVRDAVHLLMPRIASKEAAEALVREMKWYDDYLARSKVDRSANPAPGNKKGGLSNIVEKALGSAAKSGSSPIVGVLAAGERAPIYGNSEKHRHGLFFAATPASDFICGTLQLASGIHLQVFSTGRGTPYGLAMAPVIKVSSNSRLATQWPDLIDIDAGGIAEGKASIEDVGRQIFEYIIDVASGREKTWADKHELYNDLVLFNPGPVT